MTEDGISDLVHRLIDDGKAYARAEIGVAKAVAATRAAGIKTPLLLIIVAILFAHAAFLALVATLFVALAQMMAPALAGLVTVVILVAIAGLAGFAGVGRLKTLKSDVTATARS